MLVTGQDLSSDPTIRECYVGAHWHQYQSEELFVMKKKATYKKVPQTYSFSRSLGTWNKHFWPLVLYFKIFILDSSTICIILTQEVSDALNTVFRYLFQYSYRHMLEVKTKEGKWIREIMGLSTHASDFQTYSIYSTYAQIMCTRISRKP